jgi:hypothetical protein
MMPYPMVTDLPGQSIETRYFIKYFKTYDFLGFIETGDESRFRYSHMVLLTGCLYQGIVINVGF